MSIEQAIIDNTAALNRLIAVYTGMSHQPAAPVAAPAPVINPAIPAVAQMPAPPTFTMPPAAAPVQQSQSVPFTDPKGLMDYTMAAYQEMGATKGAAIQQVLASLGHANMNDVRPEQYAQFYAGVESLKRG